MTMMTLMNGYLCRSATDMGYAKKNIDPSSPKEGPFGIYASDAAKAQVQPAAIGAKRVQDDPAVRFGGLLQSVAPAGPAATSNSTTAQVRLLDVTV